MGKDYTATAAALFVDNDLSQIEPWLQMMRLRGLKIFTANGPDEAWSVLERNADQIRVVGIDILMADKRSAIIPDEEAAVAGFSLAKRIRSTWPNLPLILFSAYEPEDVIARWCAHNNVAFYLKSAYRQIIDHTIRALGARSFWKSAQRAGARLLVVLSAASVILSFIAFTTGLATLSDVLTFVKSLWQR